VARRRSSGVVASWAQAQRAQQRQEEARQRAIRNAQIEQERAVRSAARARAQGQREAWRAYQEGREADAAARTRQIDAQVEELRLVLQAVLAASPFKPEQLIRSVVVPPFNPGPLAVPASMPDQRGYQVAPPAGLRSLSAAARREYQQACRAAEQQFNFDSLAAQQAEQRRKTQLDAYYGEYLAWAEQERQLIIDHNSQVDDLARRLAAGEPEAFGEYFTAALYTVAGWSASLPRQVQARWDEAASQLIVDYELPGYVVVPAIARYRYIKTDDRETQVNRPAGERKALYRHLLAQIMLSVFVVAFRADRAHQVSAITVNGYVQGTDPATGRPAAVYIVTSTVGRQAFTRLHLAGVDPVSCLASLPGQFSSRPEQPTPVTPVSPATPATAPWTSSAGQLPETGKDLLAMDPVDFEDLVADLFRAMDMDVMTTARTGDGGVDIRAVDRDPIRGGKLIIQVKRYQHTIPPAPVRDLYGTMLHEGATKGILVTTAKFGPSAQEFAAGKPLTLIDGSQLTELLARYGLTSDARSGDERTGPKRDNLA
jgi:restriction system protein